MTIFQLKYELQDGYVHNWLAAGPQAIPVTHLKLASTEELRLKIIRQNYQKSSGITRDPVERGPMTEGMFTIGSFEGSWSYWRCQEDHFVDHSTSYAQLCYLRSWAFTQLTAAEPVEVCFVLTTHGPADLWLNGQSIHRQEHFQSPHPKGVVFKASLLPGQNKILVRWENVSASECPDAMSLRLGAADTSLEAGQYSPISGVQVEIPTLIETIDRRNELEEAFETPFMRRDVFTREDKIEICWPDDLTNNVFCDVRLQAVNGPTYAQAEVDGKPGDVLFLGFSGQFSTGPYEAFIMPRAWEYYDRNIRVQKKLPFWSIGNNNFSVSAYRTYAERWKEALTHALGVEGDLYAELAKVALKKLDAVTPGTVIKAIARVNERTPDSPLLLAGLMRLQAGFSSQPKFLRGMKEEIKEAILGYRYWKDEPGEDLMDFEVESDQILLHACELLAGQKYTDLPFRNNNQPGRWHQEHGETHCQTWLQERCAWGFSNWNSDESFEKELVALTLLADLAKDDQIGSLAIVAIDKMLYALALNSYQGVLTSSQGRASTAALLGGYLQATSGITRLEWGMGIFNPHIAGLVSLALCRNYQLPEIIADIARSTPEALWSQEKHAVNTKAGKRVANLCAYRTPDGMLASAQNYYPGEPGEAEHIWQATLGPGATVFVNHPANSSTEDDHRPSFWLGNKTLPRVGQWKDTLIAVYQLPVDDWMGYTHAYFPTFAFDEFTLRDGWAFARKGNGYLAITAANGISLTRRGKLALRELRSPGRQNTWICLMGRAALDKDYDTFQEKVLQTKTTFKKSAARLTSLRGEKISFDWAKPMRVDGDNLPLESKSHYDSLFGVAEFPASQLEIQYGVDLLRLDFKSPDEGGDVS